MWHIKSTASCAALLSAATLGACTNSKAADPAVVQAPPPAEVRLVVPSRTKALASFPCSDCHKHVVKGATPVSNPHAIIRPKHMLGAENCATCHNLENVEELRLASGITVSLDNAQDLCEQCHNRQTDDWRLGIHGKQIGNWNGDGELHRLPCASCHNPHDPSFGTMEAVPPPPFPAMGIKKVGH